MENVCNFKKDISSGGSWEILNNKFHLFKIFEVSDVVLHLWKHKYLVVHFIASFVWIETFIGMHIDDGF